MEVNPPKWADRFLAWYCNPELLEEIQGDAHELYFERLKLKNKRYADLKYILDVIRFCRWSNIKRSSHEQAGFLSIFWNLNFKIALRNALQNKLLYSIKVFGLAICLTFALVLSAFIIHEFSFDQHHLDYNRIFRVGTWVNIEGNTTNYAVSPVGMGNSFLEEIPEVENACWFTYGGKPVYSVDAAQFNNETTLVASSEFLRMLTFTFKEGTSEALDEPNRIVLTETTAKKFFGTADAMGKTIEMNETLLEVTAIISDLPANSHLQFDALISWNTYEINEGWDNINGYTYVKLKERVSIAEATDKISKTIINHREDIEGGRDHRAYEKIALGPIVENISDIHLSGYLDEDIAQKRSKTNLFILMGVVLVFFITGVINFLNLSLAELTTNFRKIGILHVFGGSNAHHSKVTYTNSFFTFISVVPLTIMLGYGCLIFARTSFSIQLEPQVFTSPVFILVGMAFIACLIFSARLNSFILSGSYSVINALKGKLNSTQTGFRLRELLVSAQLSFSMIIIALILVIVDQFQFINSMDKGFDEKNTVVVKMREGDFGRAQAFAESVRKLNGVKNVDGSSFYLDNVETKEFFEINTEQGSKKMLVTYMTCGYDYLNTMQIKLIKGRNFDPQHRTDDRAAYIINETAAKAFGWTNPLEKIISGPFGTDRTEGQVIGVVKDFHFASLHDPIEPLIVFLINEDWGIPYMFIKLAPIHDPGLISIIERQYKNVYPDSPFEWEYLDSKYTSLYQEDIEIREIFQTGLVISIVVSCLGIFSLSALLLIMRSREMGIRKIVGATPSHLLALHIRSFIKPIAVAVLIACPVIFFISGQWLQNFAYHIDVNAWHFIIPGIVAAVLILGTSAYHGIKNSLVNPVEVVRHE